MGAGNSLQEQWEEAAAESHFTQDELHRLYKRFRKLDKNGNGRVEIEEFKSSPAISNNLLHRRIFSNFDQDGGGDVDFREFITSLSIFSRKENREEKFRFAFRIYDIDNDGFISSGELFLVLKMMVGNNLKDTQLQQIVDKTIIEADKDRDGKVSFEEFLAKIGMDQGDIATQMTLPGI